jgi:UDP-3-O-[3-hydroxymyristoyl] glucosamine N-acyltransferase
MPISLSNLCVQVRAVAPELDCKIAQGSDIEVIRFADIATAQAGDICFFTNPKLSAHLDRSHAGALIVSEDTWEARDAQLMKRFSGLIICSNPYAFFAFASQVLHKINQAQTQATPAIHTSAVIHPSARIGKNVSIDTWAVIEANAVVGDDCRIGSHVFIGKGACIAEQSQLHSHVTVYHGVEIGAQCIVHSGTVIGADGFGFAPYQKRWIKIPQTGTVRVGDDVEIGANCTIDRGALGDTVIGRGTKLDNLIQIAHNVQVGEDCAFAANIAIAGSAIIGNRVQMGGKAGVLGHLSVCDDVVISSCTLITKTISKPGFYSGVYPFQENAEWEKNAVSLKRLNLLREQVKVLEKNLKPAVFAPIDSKE